MSLRPVREVGESRRKMSDLYAPIAWELAEAERIFQSELGSRFTFVQALVEHCGDFQGKRLRPALVLLGLRAVVVGVGLQWFPLAGLGVNLPDGLPERAVPARRLAELLRQEGIEIARPFDVSRGVIGDIVEQKG